MTKRDLHQRRSLRLAGFDYGREGAYFVTICTHDRTCLFGEIVNGEMRLNDVGRMIATQWRSLSKRFPSVQPDALVVMPNHMHGIIALSAVGAALVAAQGMARRINPPRRATTRVAPTRSLGTVIGAYKSLTTVEYARGVKMLGWSPFAGKLWQRNYYEHIIRNEAALNRVRQYIMDNPARWAEDPENPTRYNRPYRHCLDCR